MDNGIERVLITAEEIEEKVAELGKKISADYAGKNPIFVGVLKGCFIFMADLMRHVSIPCTMDFMSVSSYSGTSSTGAVKINKDLNQNIEGRHLILVEDILDSGVTLNYLRTYLQVRWISPATARPRSTRTMPALMCPMLSWWATVWTITSATATCPILAFSALKYTASNKRFFPFETRK